MQFQLVDEVGKGRPAGSTGAQVLEAGGARGLAFPRTAAHCWSVCARVCLSVHMCVCLYMCSHVCMYRYICVFVFVSLCICVHAFVYNLMVSYHKDIYNSTIFLY